MLMNIKIFLGKILAMSDSFEPANIFIISDFNAGVKMPSRFTPFLNACIDAPYSK